MDSLTEAGSEDVTKFLPVNSRLILGVRYNAKTHEMDVIFRTGEKYRYKKVSRSVYEGLLKVESMGHYMHKNILGRYDYERLD